MLKKGILGSVILSIIILNACHAQLKVVEAHFRDGDKAFNKLVYKSLRQQRNSKNTMVCTTSAVFARFFIDNKGNITDLAFSEPENSSPIFRQMLDSVVMSTSGKWEPRRIGEKAVKSLAYVLPLVYDMQAGCNPQTVTDSTTASKQIIKPIRNYLLEAFNQLTIFKNNEGVIQPRQAQCVWLEPLIISSIN
jgi:hypothetical protein